MRSRNTHGAFWVWWLISTITSQALLGGMVLYRNGSIDFGYRVFAVVSLSISLVCALLLRESLRSRSLSAKLSIWAFAMLPSLALFAATGLLPVLSLKLIGDWWLGSWILLGGTGWLLERLHARVKKGAGERVLVVGDYPEVRALLDRLQKRNRVPIGVLGKAEVYLRGDLARQWQGEESDIDVLLAWYDVSSLYLAMPLARFEEVCLLYQEAASRCAHVYWVPDPEMLLPLDALVKARQQPLSRPAKPARRMKNAVTIRLKRMARLVQGRRCP